MGEQNVIRLRGVTIYHTDDPFGSRSEKKLLQQGELILSDLNFDINAGEFVYLIGRVGSGKSRVDMQKIALKNRNKGKTIE